MKQRINPLVMLRARGLSGPFMQRIGGGRLIHTAGNYLGALNSALANAKLCVDFTQCNLDLTLAPPILAERAALCVDFTQCTTTAVLGVR